MNLRTITDEETTERGQEFAFHHDIFNAYIERPGQEAKVLGQPSKKKLSRRLCFVLRWGAPSLGVPIGADGYVEAKRLRGVPTLKTCTDDVIRDIAERDSKKRFGIKVAEDGGLLVRANHGHGIPGVNVVDRELTSHDGVTVLVHVSLTMHGV